MVNALFLVGAVPLGLLDASKLDPDLGLPGASHTHTSLDMNWRALLERLGTPQLPDIILSSSQHRSNHDKHKPDILLADPPSAAAAETNTPSEVKVEVPSSSSSSSSSSSHSSQEAMKTRSSESLLPLAHWLREALSVLQHKQNHEKEEEEERDGAVGREEWREAGALLRKIGDLLDGCTWDVSAIIKMSAFMGEKLSRWTLSLADKRRYCVRVGSGLTLKLDPQSGRGRMTSAALKLPVTRPLASCCCCCCCLAASVLGLLTWRLLLWCR